ncbi:putative domain 1, putative [Alloalcanivorax dieselolei B5]|uniref:Putative domain 1, putative n=1 Tax=Alcanivorax dieselolei (strain DSM 16502 / CGMCC 1.3690 / MCCC 1A00001 / B-5) TaxID=930169 RepID=K0CIZ3_ALCDB|nr:PaaI family thioesterase [Alloalcanivorax dieselolei]AFT72350.1 putative domain 1, putative [Alloalcanivorax dieselolei B5]GGJ77224.1 hypothetical protein GCM10007426_02740 [Alloalcanivorax dieselolei]
MDKNTLIDTILARPLHRACGLNLVRSADGESEVTLELNEFTLGPTGDLHGGILYAFFDVASFLALLSVLPEDRYAVSIETHTSLLRGASGEGRIVIRTRVDRLGRTLASMRGEAFFQAADGTEKLIATGSVTKAVVAKG